MSSSNKLYKIGNEIKLEHILRVTIDYERILSHLLCTTTRKRLIKMVKYLVINLNIDVNLRHEGETPLVICAEHNYPYLALFLLKNGADVDASTLNHNSPAQISASWGHTQVLYNLIIYGSNVYYNNIHLKSVIQYSYDNTKICNIVQKGLNQRKLRRKQLYLELCKILIHPIEYINVVNKDYNDNYKYYTTNNININIDTNSISIDTNYLNDYYQNNLDKIYLMKDIVKIIHEMVL